MEESRALSRNDIRIFFRSESSKYVNWILVNHLNDYSVEFLNVYTHSQHFSDKVTTA